MQRRIANFIQGVDLKLLHLWRIKTRIRNVKLSNFIPSLLGRVKVWPPQNSPDSTRNAVVSSPGWPYRRPKIKVHFVSFCPRLFIFLGRIIWSRKIQPNHPYKHWSQNSQLRSFLGGPMWFLTSSRPMTSRWLFRKHLKFSKAYF